MYPFIEVASVKIQTYFLVMILIFTGTLFWVFKRSSKVKVPKVFIMDLTFTLALSGLVFARVFHVVFENIEFYLSHPMEIFLFWNGGFVFLGGFLGAFLYGIIFAIQKKQIKFIPELMDFYSPVLALTYALGRLGCFAAGCCYGKSCPFPWAVQGLHPTQLYAFIWDFFLFLVLFGLEKKSSSLKSWKRGYLFCVWLVGHGIGRFALEFYRDDFRGPIYIFSISGWISLAMIVASLALFLLFKEKK